MTIREVASLIGTLFSTFPSVQFGLFHNRTLERDKNLALRFSSGNFDWNMSLSAASIADLTWWVTSLPTAFRTFDHGIPSICERSLYIINLELLAIKFGLMFLVNYIHHQHIIIQSHSLGAIS